MPVHMDLGSKRTYKIDKPSCSIFDIMFSRIFLHRFIITNETLLLKVTCRLEVKEAAPQVILAGVTLAQSTGRTSAQSFQCHFC